jgi:hypothetical protein
MLPASPPPPQRRTPHPDPDREHIILSLLEFGRSDNRIIDPDRRRPSRSLWWTGNASEYRSSFDCAEVWRQAKNAPADWSIVLGKYIMRSGWLPEEPGEREECLTFCRLCKTCDDQSWETPSVVAFDNSRDREHPLLWQDAKSYACQSEPSACRRVYRHRQDEHPARQPQKVGPAGFYVTSGWGAPPMPPVSRTFELHRYDRGRSVRLAEIEVPARPLDYCFSRSGSLLAVFLENELLFLVNTSDLSVSQIPLSAASAALKLSPENPVAFIPQVPALLGGLTFHMEFSRSEYFLLIAGESYIQIADVGSGRVTRTRRLDFPLLGACLSENQSECLVIAGPGYSSVATGKQPGNLNSSLYAVSLLADGAPRLVCSFVSGEDICSRAAVFHLVPAQEATAGILSEGILEAGGTPALRQENLAEQFLFVFGQRTTAKISLSDGQRQAVEAPHAEYFLAVSPGLGSVLIRAKENPAVPLLRFLPDCRLRTVVSLGHVHGYLSDHCLMGVGGNNDVFLLPLSDESEFIDLLPELGRLICAFPKDYRPEDLLLLKKFAGWEYAPAAARAWLPVLEMKMRWQVGT